MDKVKSSWKVVLILSAIVGLLSALATRKVFLGIGIMFTLFISWGMWKYIKDVTQQ